MFTQLTLHVGDDGVAVLTFNRPAKYNAWTASMLKEMFQAFELAASNDAVKVMVITGTGKYYCAGVDLSAILRCVVVLL